MRRDESLDFLKCVFIVLMVVFHLAYVGDSYPSAKTFVYTFHMSGFLLLSGFLTNVRKVPRAFFRSWMGLFIPYVVMESGYVLLSAFLPVREPVAMLTPGVWLHKLFVQPLGPYWYLHLLLLCHGLTYAVWNVCPSRRGMPLRGGLLVVLLVGLSVLFPTVGRAEVLYYAVGFLLARLQLRFDAFFRPAGTSWLLWTVLAAFPVCHQRGTVGGATITWLTVSGLLWLYAVLPKRVPAMRLCAFIGRNTLSVLLFSPIFTMLFKFAVPLFRFDPTGLLFAVTATAGTVAGSLGVTFLLDRLRLSPFFFGRPYGLN